mmetsp:Transcript_6621/g.15099  ORF Transcript_6621/g.15099 Transcript_6621/m.15099 type:complete len:109 (+) Transcript_6621:101-427(+)
MPSLQCPCPHGVTVQTEALSSRLTTTRPHIAVRRVQAAILVGRLYLSIVKEQRRLVARRGAHASELEPVSWSSSSEEALSESEGLSLAPRLHSFRRRRWDEQRQQQQK